MLQHFYGQLQLVSYSNFPSRDKIKLRDLKRGLRVVEIATT